MKTIPIYWLALGVLPLSAAQEILVAPHVDSVGLFKNGVAVVHASFEAKEAGVYRWENLPNAVHGSLWIESAAPVTLRSTTRMVHENDVPNPTLYSLQRDLGGKSVVVELKGVGTTAPVDVMGTVRSFSRDKSAWSRDFTPANPWGSFRSDPAAQPMSSFLILDDVNGASHYIDLNSISQMTTPGSAADRTHEVEKPVVLFELGQAPPAGSRVEVTYLARGLAWAPSYRLDLGGDGQLALRRSAVLRNELVDLKDTEVHLISGFPNIQFATVDSPLGGGATLASFFQDLSGQERGGSPSPMTQQMVMYNSVSTRSGASASSLPDLAELGGEGDDLYFENIGKRTLAPGDSMSLELGSAKAPFERVVEWVVPDSRDENGSYYRVGPAAPKDDEAWDALKFSNPFKFPMTTAPAMITDGGRFRGQSQSQWVNPGQSTCLRVTKALSLQTRYSESEEEGQREQIWVAGKNFQRTKVKGQLTVHNFRSKEAMMNIRASFSGELIAAEANPEKRLKTDGIRSANPHRELEWAMKLAPGEEKTLTYSYSVLVYR